MPLAAGTRIGVYEVLAKLGEGGMGEVYRARDAKLNRTIALKALHTAVAADADRVARFQREAQLLASLHHPNIAGIYGLEQSEGATYLALEFIDGKPLDALIKSEGPFAPAEATRLARQIADAVAAAHEKGIIHRDLKPGNVMVTNDGQVKVLDFGLGKSIDGLDVGRSDAGSADSPTVTLAGTQAGIILGTAGYMSPEQAKGRAADRRSDVWSFGCLLFEMLAGSRAFDGEDATETIAAVVRGEPNWKKLPTSTPPALRQLIERCLVKDRTQRLPDMSVVRYILNEPVGVAVAGRRTRLAVGFWLVGVLSALVVYNFANNSGTRSNTTPPASSGETSRFSIILPEGLEVAYANLVPLAIAPNGRLIAFPGQRLGKTQLYINDFATGQTRNVEGTDDARSPFFSPDGRWIGFFARGKLKKVTVGGTSVQELADAPDARGGAWGPDDTIYFTPRNAAGLWKVPAGGNSPAAELTTLDPANEEVSHRNPYVVEGGKALLFLVWTGPGADEHRIEYLSLADGKRQLVLQNADGPVAVANGQLVYGGRQDTLLSAPWDHLRPNLQGVEPKALPFLALLENEGVASSAVAPNGTVVHLLGDTNRRLARVEWVAKTGKSEPLPIPDRDYVSATLSPDGTRAAIQIRGGKDEIWIFDLRTKSFVPLLTPGSSQAPVWTVDSKYIAYRGTRQGFRNIYMKAADGSGDEIQLTTKAGMHTPMAVTPDGKWILYAYGGNMSADVWKVAIAAPHEIQPVLTTPQAELSTQVSPDGQWVTFDSQVSGRSEVWMQPFSAPPAGAAMRQLSRDGGRMSRWARDGREVYFVSPEGLMAVSVNGGSFSAPRLIVRGRFRQSANANTNYDVSIDGRFMLVRPLYPERPLTRIEVVLNGIER